MLETKGYHQKNQPDIQAVEVTQENISELATWSGGYATNDSVIIPTLQAPMHVFIGEFVVFDIKTGRFTGMSPEDFHNKYEEN